MEHNDMEQGKQGMIEDSEEQALIRRYLLKNLGDEAGMRRIEEKIMLDDEFNERVTLVEDALIEEYLDDELTETERRDFVEHFLASPEKKRNFRMIRNLRLLADKTKVEDSLTAVEKKNGFLGLKTLFHSPVFRFAALILIISGLGFAVWRVAFYESDTDKGLNLLRAAYRGQRPIESRTSAGIPYSPVSATRGSGPAISDIKARDRAQRILLDAAADRSDAEAHRALGLFYLTGNEFDKALDELNLALNLDPNDAQLYADLGATLFEMGKRAQLNQDSAKSLEFFDQSIKNSEKAIALNPKLMEPRFNRALCFQILPAPEEAKNAWREYLEIDRDSMWAEEARYNLRLLEERQRSDQSGAELERDFLNTVRANDETRAWNLLSQNRELIQEKYLPQRLAGSYLKADDKEKGDYLAALKYAGELEEKHTRDPFVSDLARFYTNLSNIQIDQLKKAHSFVQNGYRFGRAEEYHKALIEFETAYRIFIRSGNALEAELSRYSIAYYFYNDNKLNESLVVFDQIANFCSNKNYKWLQQSALHWTAGGYVALRKHAQARKNYQKALTIAEDIKDSFAIQRNLSGLAALDSSVGQNRSAATYMQKVLEESKSSNVSLRQRWRNYYSMLKVMVSAKLYHVAKAFGRESMHLAKENRNPVFITLSYIGTGTAYVQSGEFLEARNWLIDGRREAENMMDESARKKITAHSYLRLAHLERQAGNIEISIPLYDEAIRIYETLNLPFYLYECYKGRLLAYVSLGKRQELEVQISQTLRLAEDYRTEIRDEQERNSFFDTEQDVYDIATEYEFNRGNYEGAYNYAEKSNSRSLLDWLQKGVKVSGSGHDLEITLEESTSPLTAAEIRQRVPDNVQLLQYSIVKNNILIWVVSKRKFSAVSVAISSDFLQERVRTYVKLLQGGDSAAQQQADNLSRELYDILVTPIINQLDPTQDICLIPSKILFYLPFGALLSREGSPFLADFNLVYSPSANVFLLCTKQAAEKSSLVEEAFFGVGNPTFNSRDFDLEALPEAEEEIRAAASFYESSFKLIGKEATKTSFKKGIKNAEVVHFAGHYVVVPESPLTSYLLLARDGGSEHNSILNNSELIGEKLPRAKLVVLSACQTGVEDFYQGEGLIGLSRTFLAAGVPVVVASQWKVDSRATAELMKRFHFYRRHANLTTAAALRRSQLEMYESADGRFRAPYYWAGFSAFGGSARF